MASSSSAGGAGGVSRKACRCPYVKHKGGCGSFTPLCRNSVVQRLWYILSFQDMVLSVGAFVVVSLTLWLVRRGGYSLLQLLFAVLLLRTLFSTVMGLLKCCSATSAPPADGAATGEQPAQEAVSGSLVEEEEDDEEGSDEEGTGSGEVRCAAAPGTGLGQLVGLVVHGAGCLLSKLNAPTTCLLWRLKALLILFIGFLVSGWISLFGLLYWGCTAILVHNAIRRFFPGPVEMAHNYVKMGVHLASSKIGAVVPLIPGLRPKQD